MDNSTKTNSKLYPGVQNPIQLKTANQKIFPQEHFSISNQSNARNVKTGAKTIEIKRYSGKPVSEWFSLRNVPAKEDGWLFPTYIQPERLKPIRPNTKISPFKSPKNSDTLVQKQLHDEAGHIAGILSFTSITQSSPLPIPQFSGESLSNDVPTVRVSERTSSFRQNHQLDCSYFKRPRHKDTSLFRRLPTNPRRSTCPGKSDQIRRQILTEIRLASKSRKVLLDCHDKIRIPWNNLGYQAKPKVTIGKQDSPPYDASGVCDKEKSLELARCKGYSGEAELCVIRSTTRAPPQSLSPKGIKSFTNDETTPAIGNTTPCYGRAHLVENEYPKRLTDTHTTAISFHNDRCCGQGLGSCNKWSEVLGHMDKCAAEVAQQSKGTLHIVRSLNTSPLFYRRQNSDVTDRQSNYRILHNETRRYEVLETTGDFTKNFGTLPTSALSPHSPLYTRSIQRSGGQPLPRKRSSRMAPQAIGSINDIPKAGHPCDRSVCICEICGGADICQRRRKRHTQSIYRCVQQDVAVQTGMDLPSSVVDTSRDSSSEQIGRNVLNSDSQLDEGVLDGRFKGKGNLPTNPNNRSEVEFDRSSDKSTTSERRELKFVGLEGTGWNKQLQNWSNTDINLLETSWRKSSLKTYKPAWSRWQAWARTNNISADNPSPSDLAKYLCHLYNSVGLAPRTIALHKSVVATMANPQRSEELTSHHLVKHVLKAIFLKNPPTKKAIPWKINDLLDFLRTYVINEDSLFQIFRHTCVLLLLASGRRVHDLTLLSIQKGLFMDNGDEVILWPQFGSKTDSSTYRQSGWVLKNNTNEARLNLVLWIKKSISASQERRKEKNLKNLFITTRGTVKNASRCVISGWIRTLFREAGISASAGSFRAAVASENWTNNKYNIDDILKRGNWRSKNTFFNHYFRETAANCINNYSHNTRVLSDDFSTL